jgi:hypothetical protein
MPAAWLGPYSMPLRLLRFYGTLNVAGYLAVYAVAGANRPAYVPVELAGLLATSAACAHQHHAAGRLDGERPLRFVGGRPQGRAADARAATTQTRGLCDDSRLGPNTPDQTSRAFVGPWRSATASKSRDRLAKSQDVC